MTLLQKMAKLAARKMFVQAVIEKSPAEIKPRIEQICAHGPTLDALQHYATVTSKQEGQYPLTAPMVQGMDMPDESKQLITEEPAVLAFLNALLVQFQTSK